MGKELSNGEKALNVLKRLQAENPGKYTDCFHSFIKGKWVSSGATPEEVLGSAEAYRVANFPYKVPDIIVIDDCHKGS
jgi:hypothetical protein